MTERTLTLPEIALIASTRVALGLGIGLLIAGRLSDDQRRGAGWALALISGLTTVPLIVGIAHRRNDKEEIAPAA